MRRTTTTLLAVAVLVAAGCSGDASAPEQSGPDATAPPTPSPTSDATSPDDDPDATSPDDDPSDDVDAMAFAECEADRYTVGYPEGWNTNSADGLLEPCEIFHPGEIDEPERARDRDLHYAVSMYVDAIEFDDRAAADNPNDVIEERETTVDGRRALVIEFRSTGDALVPEGERSYSYAVDLDGQVLVATTSSVGDTDYERDKRLLDRMVTEELTIDDGTAMIDGPATTDRSTQEPDRGRLAVTDVDVGAHEGFDRLVFELTGDGDAGWLIEYVDDPRSQGSGHEVEIEGEAVLRIALRHIAYPADAPAEPYDGPQRIEPSRTDAIVEVLQDTLYEGYQDFFVGLDEERPYRVERLSDPQRVVIDIETG